MNRIFAAVAVMFAVHPGRPLARPLVVDLGQLGMGTNGQANSVNDRREVVGYSCEPAGCRAFRWAPLSGMTDLGSLGGTSANALRVTPWGTVIGSSSLAGDVAYRPFVWTRLGGLVPVDESLGGDLVMTRDASDWGQIVGTSTLADPSLHHAFSWTGPGGMVDLGTLGGSYSVAMGVAGAGQVAGYSTTAGDAETHGFYWTEATGMVDLGTLGGSWSMAEAVSSTGQVVGSSTVAGGGQHAFSWRPETGVMTDLGVLPGSTFSQALYVNARGQVAGVSGASAFLWTAADGLVDLGSLGGGFSYPYALATSGQVVGSSLLRGGAATHAFSWTRKGGMIDLPPLPGGTDSYAMAVSPSGALVVGASTTAVSGELRPVLWILR